MHNQTPEGIWNTNILPQQTLRKTATSQIQLHGQNSSAAQAKVVGLLVFFSLLFLIAINSSQMVTTPVFQLMVLYFLETVLA